MSTHSHASVFPCLFFCAILKTETDLNYFRIVESKAPSGYEECVGKSWRVSVSSGLTSGRDVRSKKNTNHKSKEERE